MGFDGGSSGSSQRSCTVTQSILNAQAQFRPWVSARWFVPDGLVGLVAMSWMQSPDVAIHESLVEVGS